MAEQDQVIMDLQAQGDSYARALDMEYQRNAALDAEIKEVRAEVMGLRQARKVVKCYDHMAGGVNAAKETNANISKEIRILENRLNKMLIRHSEAVNENKRDPREGVDILKHMMGEFEMLKDMQASGTFDPPGFDSKDLPDIDV